MNDKEKVQHLLDSSIRPYGYTFSKLDLGYFVVSAQGSEGHYCSPKENLQKISSYSSLEVAIFDIYGNWLSPKDHEFMKEFKWANLFIDAGAKNPIATFVEIEIVKEIIFDLLVLSRKYMN